MDETEQRIEASYRRGIISGLELSRELIGGADSLETSRLLVHRACKTARELRVERGPILPAIKGAVFGGHR